VWIITEIALPSPDTRSSSFQTFQGTFAGTNTFVVDTGALPNGPIEITIETLPVRHRDLSDHSALSGSDQNSSHMPIRSHQEETQGGRNGKWPLHFGHSSFLWPGLIVAALFLFVSGRAARENARKTDYEADSENQLVNEQAPVKELNTRSVVRRFFMALMLSLGVSKDAVAQDIDCNVDCMDAYNPLPEQVKYQTKLDLEESFNNTLDLRPESSENYTCGDNIDIYMLSGTQDWGAIVNDTISLLTPIYG